MYKRRYLEEKIKRIVKSFKVVLIVGARQVGKSTMLSHLFPNYKHVTFDPVQDIYGAQSDPDLFLQNFPAPVILDEIQYAPNLLASLKRKVDQSDAKGQYLLTGSQNLSVMKRVSESMAGRVAILHLGGITPYEAAQVPWQSSWLEHYLQRPDTIQKQFNGILPSTETLYERIWWGNYPGLIGQSAEDIQSFFSSYVSTYVERDVRLLENVRDLQQFERFLRLAAALTAQEINYSELGREVDVSSVTANRWLDLLSYTYLWINCWAYSGNTIKRLSTKPKGYFADTGLACYLQRVSSPEALASHPLLGALFESFCVSMIQALSDNLSLAPYFYHWRTNGGAEVDLILERDGMLYPIEIKCKSVVSLGDARGIKAFRETYPNAKIAPGLVLYAGTECYYLDKDIIAMPWNAICK